VLTVLNCYNVNYLISAYATLIGFVHMIKRRIYYRKERCGIITPKNPSLELVL